MLIIIMRTSIVYQHQSKLIMGIIHLAVIMTCNLLFFIVIEPIKLCYSQCYFQFGFCFCFRFVNCYFIMVSVNFGNSLGSWF